MDLSEFHFLRPWWWLALIPMLWIAWSGARSAAAARGWASVVDPQLLPHLIEGQAPAGRRLQARSPWVLAGLIGIAALAGPTWEHRELPLSQSTAARVFVLDLSPSMGAADVLPNRHTRARFKLRDALERIKDGTTALVVYSGDAFVVAPLSDDTATLANFLDALEPGVLPITGERADLALARAGALLTQAGHREGDIILISDGVSASAAREAAALRERGFRTSVLAVGTEQGAPVADENGRLITDRDGRIRIAAVDLESLAKLVGAGGGVLVRLSADERDLAALLDLDPQAERAQGARAGNLHGQWLDRGPWLALLLIPLLAWSFRRGLVYLIPLALIPTLMPSPAQAFEWSDLWLNREQRAAERIARQDYEAARGLTREPMRAGEAAFRAEQFEAAVEEFAKADGADADYNRGNALAKLQRWDEAIAAYDEALKQAPSHEDAAANKAAIEQLKQQQQQQGEGQSQQGQQGEGQQSQDPSSGDPQQNPQSDGEQGQDSQSGDSQQQGQPSSESPDQSSGSQQTEGESPATDTQAQEQAAREAAEQAHAEAMSQALDQNAQDAAEQQAQAQQQPGQATPEDGQPQPPSAEEIAESEAAQATEQWLRRIPDDPGALLRRKFLIEHRRRGNLPMPAEDGR